MAISCPPCQKSFQSPRDLHRHLTSATHGNGQKCDYCRQSMSSPWDEVAFVAHLNSQKHLLRCNDCERSFKTKSDWKNHMKNAPAHTKAPIVLPTRNKPSESRPSKAVVSRSTEKVAAFNSSSSAHLPPTKQTITKSAGKQPAHDIKTTTPLPTAKPTVKPTINESKGKLPALNSGPAASPAAFLPTNKAAVHKPNKKVPALGSEASSSASHPIGNVSNNDVTSFPWSTTIPVSQETEALEELSKHCHSPADLNKFIYRLSPYTDSEIDGLIKCGKCGKKKKEIRGSSSSLCFFHLKKKKWKTYPCCGQSGNGCRMNPSHDFTSTSSVAKFKGFLPCPPNYFSTPKSRAVVLDCEMAGVIGNDNEVIQVCAADYLTGVVLLERYVFPNAPVNDWRSRIHGIKSSDVMNALENGLALSGWEATRQALWSIIDDNTILIGHALHHDLAALRMIHHRIVDSSILTKNAVNLGKRQFGLESLFKDFLHTKIRNNKGKVHSCEEDVFATREVVMWCINHKKEFQEWADLIRAEERRKIDATKIAQREKGKVKSRRRRYDSDDYDDEYDEDEVVRWEDIAEDLGWPHPDTGYDPWSD